MRHFAIDIPMVWGCVRAVRSQVALALEAFPDDLRDATLMTASELLENAIKYGEDVPDAPTALFELYVGEGEIRFEVRNGTTSRESVGRVMQRVSELGNAEDREAIYIRHLTELLSDPVRSGELGLYRIGFEGKFDLSCSYVGQVLTVKATRKYDE